MPAAAASSDDAQRPLRWDDDEHGANRLRESAERAKAAFTVNQIGFGIDRVDAVSLPAQLARRKIPEPFAGSGYADHGNGRFGQERID